MSAKIICVPITPISNSQQTVRKLDLMTDGNPIYPIMEKDLNKFFSNRQGNTFFQGRDELSIFLP